MNISPEWKSLIEDIYNAEELLGDHWEKCYAKMSGGKLTTGAICAWCEKDDLKWWKELKEPMPHPKDWHYNGIIIPVPDA